MTQIQKYLDTLTFVARLDPSEQLAGAIASLPSNAHLDLLRQWQAARLERTYTDLLANRRFGPACRFFLDELYGAKDFRKRDAEIKYLYAQMKRILPEFLLGLVRQAIELNDLTNELDTALLLALRNDLGVTDRVTPELYAEGYRVCDNYTARAHQIDLIVQTGHKVDFAARLPLIATTLKLARGPAHHAGWGDMQDFLEKGYLAFKHLHGGGEFLKIIHDREMDILNKIFERHPEPFGSPVVS